jgi:coenzyme F420 hydrogenase subunit beta
MSLTERSGENLQSGVNERRFPICCYCGACAAFIPDFEKYSEDEAVFEKGCGGTISKGFCFSFCPRSFAVCRLCEEECPRLEYGVCDFSPSMSSPEGRILGYYKEILSARATDKGIRGVGKDGGVITALLYEALKSGFIDAAVIATRTEDWKAKPFIATTPEEVLLGRGPKYTASPSVLGVWEAIDTGYQNIAMVGTGCNIEAVRRLQALRNPALELERMKLLIGVFSTEAFWHRKLVQFLSEEYGIDIRAVERFFVSKGKFIVVTRDKEISVPLKDVVRCTRDTCKICEDASSQLADISAGSVGSPDGWTTLIIRTEIGEELVMAAACEGVIETMKLGSEEINEIERFALNKKTRNYGLILDQMEICSACFTVPFPFALQLRGGL